MNENHEPTAVFALKHPWVQAIIREVAQATAPDFKLMLLDPDDQEQLEQMLPRATFLVTLKLPSDWIPLLKRCQLVQVNGVGYDKIDVLGLRRSDIPLAISPQGTAAGVGEHTILFILALCKQL
jgi:phosphoglycerate dehydrogenase-like enzyme